MDIADLQYDDIESCNYYDQVTFQSQFNDNSNFFVIHINIRSFNANFSGFAAYVDSLHIKPNVIILTETWFSQLFCGSIEGYKSYHTHRPDRSGGGVSIFVSAVLNSTYLPQLSSISNVVETCGVKIDISRNFSINVIGVYRPPLYNLNDFNDIFFNNFLPLIKTNSNILIAGDLNADLLNPNATEVDLISNFHSKFFIPHITKATRTTNTSATCIDHIWSNITTKSFPGIFDAHISDHFPIFIVFMLYKPNQKVKIKFRDHSSRNLELLRNRSNVLGRDFPLTDRHDVETNTERFCDELYEIYNTCCPMREKFVSANKLSKPWITTDLRLAINRKHALFRDYKRDHIDFNAYSSYNNKLTNTLRSSKLEYFRHRFERCRGDVKGSWRTINGMLGRMKTRGPSIERLQEGNHTVTESTDIANALNSHFVSVGDKLAQQIPPSPIDPLLYIRNNPQNSMFADPSSPMEVNCLIRSLPNKSAGPNTIPTFIYKLLVDELSPTISKLFNASIMYSIFPSCLKHARVTPIFKSGSRELLPNYRPISVLSILAKIFEKLMYRRLLAYSGEAGLIGGNQFGFKPGVGTVDAVLTLLTDIYDEMERSRCFIALLLDFSKAFDTVDHRVLLRKLERLGVRGTVLSWFSSYLADRTQQVAVNGVNSHTLQVRTGLPQGSVLSTILFNLYIDDMAGAGGRLNCLHYADDTTLYFAHDCQETAFRIMNTELLSIDNWLKANKLSLNLSKTVYMVISNKQVSDFESIKIRGVEVSRVPSAKFLGITLDNQLNFKTHVDTLRKKVSRNIGAINRISYYIPNYILRQLYYSLIMPYISYGVAAWGGVGLVNGAKISRVHDRALRMLTGIFVEGNEINHSILNFDSLYKYFTALKLYEVLYHNRIPKLNERLSTLQPVHLYPTRFVNINNLNTPHFRLSMCQQGFLAKSINIWNQLPSEIREIPHILKFKRTLKHYLLSKQSQP